MCPPPSRDRPWACPDRSRAVAMTRPAPAPPPVVKGERRSGCETVRLCPRLKLAIDRLGEAVADPAQVIEAANDIGPRATTAETALYPYKSCIPCRTLPPVSGRGGARNRASRRSKALSEADARKVLDAAHYAVMAGLPFNRFTTVHWERAGVADGLGATGRFLKLAGDWIRSRGGRAAWVWVREGGLAKGAHVHILMHLSPDLADGFNRRQRCWLRACGATWRAGVLFSRPIGRTLRHAMIGGDDYSANLGETLDYVLKGADTAARERLAIRRCEPGGETVGKRCGVSQNLGPTTRADLKNDRFSQAITENLAVA